MGEENWYEDYRQVGHQNIHGDKRIFDINPDDMRYGKYKNKKERINQKFTLDFVAGFDQDDGYQGH